MTTRRLAIHDRHILLAFVGAVAVAICWGRLAFVSEATSISSLFEDRHVGANVGELLAVLALYSVALSVRQELPLSTRDLLAIALTSVAFATPSLSAAAVPMTVVGLIFAARRDFRLSSFGQVLLALVFYEWLGPILFNLFSPIVLSVETSAVQGLLSLLGGFTRDELTIRAANGHAIYIDSGCSAFRNLSLATLIWISLIKVLTLPFSRHQLWILAAMTGATIFLNTARIALLAESRANSDTLDAFNYWHGGPGYAIISLAILAAMLGIFMSGQLLIQRR